MARRRLRADGPGLAARQQVPSYQKSRTSQCRGIAELTGLAPAAEVAGWRPFPSARAFMGFTGLVPAEYSSGERQLR